MPTERQILLPEQCTIHNSLARTQTCLQRRHRIRNKCFFCCNYLKMHSSALLCRCREKTANLQIRHFCPIFLVIVLSSHLPDRTEPCNSPHKSSIHFKCHQTVGASASFSGCLTFHTDFPCLAATPAMRGHNVFSVFL